MLSTELKGIATELISEFGGQGYLNYNDVKADPITGVGANSSKRQEIRYIREYFNSEELVEGVILNGDARITFVSDTKPKTSYGFTDVNGVDWSILSITPIEVNGSDVVYTGLIRR